MHKYCTYIHYATVLKYLNTVIKKLTYIHATILIRNYSRWEVQFTVATSEYSKLGYKISVEFKDGHSVILAFSDIEKALVVTMNAIWAGQITWSISFGGERKQELSTDGHTVNAVVPHVSDVHVACLIESYVIRFTGFG